MIPHGKCVTPDIKGGQANKELVALFRELDQGVDSPERMQQAVEVARAACMSCVQLPNCTRQRGEIVSVLWRRGAGAAMIGGEVLKRRVQMVPRFTDKPILEFDLAQLPYEPGWLQYILRQAVCSGQLTLKGNPSKLARAASRTFIEQQSGTAWWAALMEQIKGRASRTAEEGAKKAVERVTTGVAMIWAKALSFGSKERGMTAGDMYDRLCTLFLKDAADIAQAGLTHPERLVFYHDPATYKKLLLMCGELAVSTGRFTELLRSDLSTPYALVNGYVARYDLLVEFCAERGIPMLPTNLQYYALTESRTQAFKDRYSERRPSSAAMTLGTSDKKKSVATVKPRTSKQKSDPSNKQTPARVSPLPGVNAQTDIHVRYLQEYFRDHPDAQAMVRPFAANAAKSGKLPVEVIKDMERSLGTLARYRRLMSPYGFRIPDSFLMEISIRRHNFKAPQHIHQAYLVARMSQRFLARLSGGDGEAAGYRYIPSWIVHRVVKAYGLREADLAGERFYEFFIKKPILVAASGGLRSLYDRLLSDMALQVCDPVSRKRIAPAAALGELQGLERLALLRYCGLEKLVYGREADEAALVRGLNIQDLGGYVRGQLLPRLPSIQDKRPLPLELLGEDVRAMLRYQAPNKTEVSPALAEGAATVVGAWQSETQVAPEKELFAYLPPAQRQFMREAIVLYVPPDQQAWASSQIDKALQCGIVEIAGGGSQNSYLQFSGPLRQLPHAAIAAMACVTNIAPLLYPSDPQITLRSIWGNEWGTYFYEQILPKIRRALEGDSAYDLSVLEAGRGLLTPPL